MLFNVAPTDGSIRSIVDVTMDAPGIMLMAGFSALYIFDPVPVMKEPIFDAPFLIPFHTRPKKPLTLSQTPIYADVQIAFSSFA